MALAKPPAENPDGSRTEPSGRGYFGGAFNGADVAEIVNDGYPWPLALRVQGFLSVEHFHRRDK